MRTINSKLIAETVKELCIKANLELRKDILSALRRAREKETSSKARGVLDIIIYNALLARKKRLPICQDTGMVVAYVAIGQEVRIKGVFRKAVERGVAEAYRCSYFRNSIVMDPLRRKNTKNNLPSIIYTCIVPGKRLNIRISVKGFGCENISRTRMFRPTDSASLIEDFVVEAVKDSGSRACPPVYIGVGMGGTIDKATLLSKEAVFRSVAGCSRKRHIAKLEKSILAKVNSLKIGPMGVGGRTTALGVSVLSYPTHIAGLPVAVNISCHATRDARKVI